jgi:hypothetical protein
MTDTNAIALGILIVLAFIWRFARTRQLYLTSFRVLVYGAEPAPFRPHDLRSFVQQALLGRRSVSPISFFIRALVFGVVAAFLLPFKDYEPPLFWLVVALIALYVPWCVAHGFMLKGKLRDGGAS